MDLQDTLAMLNYSVNSGAQSMIVDSMTTVLERAIVGGNFLEDLLQNSKGLFCIADLGCATGSNTLFTMDSLIQFLKRMIVEKGTEFQVFFCDLPSNDFNTLLRSLPPLIHTPEQQFISKDSSPEDTNSISTKSRSYFAAAVSGSYFHRLFPYRSLHFCHSSLSLHWLSKVPPSVEDQNSPAWNKGHVHVSNNIEVAKAYLQQFTEDLTSFLNARAQELVPKGGLFIAMVGRQGIQPLTHQGCFKHCLDSHEHCLDSHVEKILKDMVAEGLIEEEMIDRLNIPLFWPSVEEIERIVKGQGCFEVKESGIVKGFCEAAVIAGNDMGDEERLTFGKQAEGFHRGFLQAIIEAHFGGNEKGHLVDDFFGRICKMACNTPREYSAGRGEIVFAFLVRTEA